jgi:hypothetical protein
LCFFFIIIFTTITTATITTTSITPIMPVTTDPEVEEVEAADAETLARDGSIVNQPYTDNRLATDTDNRLATDNDKYVGAVSIHCRPRVCWLAWTTDVNVTQKSLQSG